MGLGLGFGVREGAAHVHAAQLAEHLVERLDSAVVVALGQLSLGLLRQLEHLLELLILLPRADLVGGRGRGRLRVGVGVSARVGARVGARVRVRGRVRGRGRCHLVGVPGLGLGLGLGVGVTWSGSYLSTLLKKARAFLPG